MRKPGFTYEAHVEVTFENAAQAGSFAMKQTTIGVTVAEDLRDPEVQAEMDAGETMTCEVTFPDPYGEEEPGVAEELEAAVHVGAAITVTCGWVKNGA